MAGPGCTNEESPATAVGTSALDVTQFGARGDGIADDTDAIQAALDQAARGRYGGTVYLPAGIYLVSNSLIVGSRTRVVGDGPGVTIVRGHAGSYQGRWVNGNAVTATVASVAANHTLIENLTVDHATNGTWANGIVFLPDGMNGSGVVCSDCTVRGCEVLGFDRHEYLIWTLRSRHLRVLDNRLDGFVTDFARRSNQEGIEAFGGYDVVIRGNQISRVGNAGINAGAATGVANAGVGGIRIVENHIEASRVGIHLGTAFDSTTGPQNITGALVMGNTVTGSYEQGIFLDTPIAGTTLTNVVIVGNVITDADTGVTLYGIRGETSHHGVVLRGNVIEGARSTTIGAVSAFYMSNMVIAGNVISNSASVALWLIGLSCAHVSGNVVDGVENEAILAESCDMLDVAANHFRNYARNGLTAGVLITSSAKTVFRNNTLAQDGIGTDVIVSGDEAVVACNVALTGAAVPFLNMGSNPNFGTIAMVAGAHTVDIANALVNDGSHFNVTQMSGAPTAFRIERIAGGFCIRIAVVAAGDETFRWEISQ
jgi:hypothetical protein